MVEGPPASGIILSEGPPPDALVKFALKSLKSGIEVVFLL